MITHEDQRTRVVGPWRGHHSKVCRRTEPRLNRSTPATVEALPPVGTAALQRSVLQQEVSVLIMVPRISVVGGFLGQAARQRLFFTFCLIESKATSIT